MEKKPEPSIWTFQDETNYSHIKMRYADRDAMGAEAISKRKQLADMTQDNPFYHRAAAGAEMAALRYDMAHIVAKNEQLMEYVGTISWLHEQLSIVQGAYQHVKMLAEQSKIDYRLIHNGLEQIVKLKKELANEVEQRDNRPDGKKG